MIIVLMFSGVLPSASPPGAVHGDIDSAPGFHADGHAGAQETGRRTGRSRAEMGTAADEGRGRFRR